MLTSGCCGRSIDTSSGDSTHRAKIDPHWEKAEIEEGRMTKPGQPRRPRFITNRLLTPIIDAKKHRNTIQTQTAKPVYQKSASIIYLPPDNHLETARERPATPLGFEARNRRAALYVRSSRPRNESIGRGLNPGLVAELRRVLGTPFRSSCPLAEWTAGANVARRCQFHQEALRNGTRYAGMALGNSDVDRCR